MIAGISWGDFSFRFHTPHSHIPSSLLAREMDEALARFRERIREGEVRHQLDKSLLNIIDSGIFVLGAGEEIEWINPAALRALGVSKLDRLAELENSIPTFPEQIRSLQPGRVIVIHTEDNRKKQELAITKTLFTSQEKRLELISLKDIRTVLEKSEIESWQKLIRVLTHEIMNSITPIISLADTLTERTAKERWEEKERPVIKQGLHTIHQRSKGLLEFVENYRKLTRIPLPELKKEFLEEILREICSLYPAADIRLDHPSGETFPVEIDRTQIEQVLVNLIKNSLEATREIPDPQITITLEQSENIVRMILTDNGKGIAPEAIDKIFIPFFTTKQSGSGIGLTLCKQIMNLHGRSITATSSAREGTSFHLSFPVFPEKG
ncbi:MAG: PAS domain-containing sensor histidine kinase [Bacteroides sp.]|nr:PAS domain-containing sensor histidine kinase [Bacteroides sp.]